MPLGKQRYARSRSRQVDKSTEMKNDREAHAEGGTGKGQILDERRAGWESEEEMLAALWPWTILP
jgi:hypothetical protein